ncbi:MAG: 2-amino-4-hydroxy-6-hydroxymethyldihydropteridine diphosphokinase [Planctomycetota bacterium]|nr:2-amino-4-hydroxy-6-hydroxymethyldihydropteridine diphosphokinase [Planctomycetota bacterium]
MTACLIALGSNLGNRADTLDRAVLMLRDTPDVRLLAVSQWHETEPVGGPAGQSAFLNGAAVIKTELSALSLLQLLQQVEDSLGRIRQEHWGPRTIDLDLLLYGDRQIDLPELKVPHPLMTTRRFVLEPAAEVAPEMIHPTNGLTISQLLQQLVNLQD